MSTLSNYDKSYKNYKNIAGVDEAGRGPLFGPVCVASCVMPLEDDKILEEVNDSKKLSAKKREELYEKIVKLAKDYKVVMIDNKTIDEINILNATKLGMKQVIDGINSDLVLIDAVKLDTDKKTESIIHGDALSYNIACASIIAKVTRDRYIQSIAPNFPEYYNLIQNKGYPTVEHRKAIKEHGITSMHRKSFIKNVENW